MLKFVVLSLAVSCTLGCSSGPSYVVVHEDQDLCSDFETHASSEVNTTLLHYATKAVLAFHIDDEGKQIRFDGKVDGWHAECLNETTESDFECSILMAHVLFNDYNEINPGFRLGINAVFPRVLLVNFRIHLHLQFRSFETFQITEVPTVVLGEIFGFSDNEYDLESLVFALLRGFHGALISIDCKA